MLKSEQVKFWKTKHKKFGFWKSGFQHSTIPELLCEIDYNIPKLDNF